MAIKSSLAQPLLYIAVLSGVVFGLLLVFISHEAKPYATWSNIALVFSMQLAVTMVVGYVTGFVLKNKITNSYFVSIMAMLYLYDAATLLAFVRGFGYIIFALLLALTSVGLFYSANKLFAKYSSYRKKFTMFGMVGFVILFIICAPLGLFLTRLISLTSIH